MAPSPEAAALLRVPDLPLRVDTRGMLLARRHFVAFAPGADPATAGFIVGLASRALLSVVGEPPPDLIARTATAMAGDVNVLCAAEDAAHVARSLPGWRQHPVVIHALPGVMSWEAEAEQEVSVFGADGAPPLDHLPDSLRAEMVKALDGHPSARFVPGALPVPAPADREPLSIPIAAAWVDALPVAFCYPALQTETLWDVSVDTLEGYRGRGLAGRAARAMVRHLRGRGKAPVWGALARNDASLAVARRLGFVEEGRITVFTPR